MDSTSSQARSLASTKRREVLISKISKKSAHSPHFELFEFFEARQFDLSSPSLRVSVHSVVNSSIN